MRVLCNGGAAIITNTIVGVPYGDYGVIYPKTLLCVLIIEAPTLRVCVFRPCGAMLNSPMQSPIEVCFFIHICSTPSFHYSGG